MLKSNALISILGVCCAPVLASTGCSAVDLEARKALMKNLGSTSFTVFPAAVRREAMSHDENSAIRLGELITAQGLGEARISDAHISITGPWHMNQARMLRESAAEFASYVKDHPIQTEYAVLPEYLIGGKGSVVGVHGYIVDKEGRVAFVVLQNSKWPAFQEVNPQTVEDCTEVLERALREELVTPGG